MIPAQQSFDPIEVFFSYSHKDEDMRDELANHLKVLERQNVITAWHDRRIGAGEEWKNAIDGHMESAHIILLLISSNFMASDYCYDTEMERAIERHDAGEARVIPIILHPLYWKIAPFAKLQALPTDAKAVSTWSNQHEAFANIASGIHAAIKELNPTSSNHRHRSKILNIPHRKNPNFTGREDLLTRLRESLISNQHAALTQAALHGLGGVGKTQLAVEYTYRHEQDYAFVWWVRAEEAAMLAADYAALAGELNLKEKNAKDQNTIIKAVRHHLEQKENWLLIFDNADKEAEVFEYLPSTSSGHVIITSRNPNWRGTASPLSVDVMESSDAVDFLNKRSGQSDKTGAASLAKELGYLPLALEQAGAYIEQSAISYDEYLKLFREYQHELLNEGTPSPDYPDTVATTWNISFQKVQEASPEGSSLLNLCAYLAPDDIPVELIQKGTSHLPESLARAMADPLLFNKSIIMLRRYSLVGREEEMLSIHRLVQAITRDRLDKETRNTWCATALRLVANSFPYDSDDVRTWPECSRLLPHALTVNGHIASLDITPEDTGKLLNQVGLFLKEKAEFAEAKEIFERALKIDEKAFGSEHPTVATRVNNLASVLESLGDFKGAKEMFERALKIDEKAFGPEHPKVAIYANNLGVILKLFGDLEGAKEMFERALKIGEKAFGSEHPTIATRVNNLASVLESLGDLKGAKEMFERALMINEKAFGLEHPTVAVCVNSLGGVLESLGDLKGAKEHYERALRIDEKAFGPEHPKVATRVNNLGGIQRSLGDLKGAKEHCERALRINEKAFGPEHPKVAVCVNDLGLVLKLLGDLKGAKEHYERALRIDEKAFGSEHSRVAGIVSNLAGVLQSLGDLKGAKEHCERALRIDEKAFGPGHPKVAVIVNNLAGVLYELGDLKGAKESYKRAFQILRIYLGDEHPNTRFVKNSLEILESRNN